MSFSDADLKRFKDALSGDMPDTSIWSKADLEVLQALLARLEASEKVCEHIKENGFPKDMRDRAYDYMNAWRKSAGKGGA